MPPDKKLVKVLVSVEVEDGLIDEQATLEAISEFFFGIDQGEIPHRNPRVEIQK